MSADEIEARRALGRHLDELAKLAAEGSETQHAMRLGARVARGMAFRALIERHCGEGAYEELGFAAGRSMTPSMLERRAADDEEAGRA
jgi:hypothetical protein